MSLHDPLVMRIDWFAQPWQAHISVNIKPEPGSRSYWLLIYRQPTSAASAETSQTCTIVVATQNIDSCSFNNNLSTKLQQSIFEMSKAKKTDCVTPHTIKWKYNTVLKRPFLDDGKPEIQMYMRKRKITQLNMHFLRVCCCIVTSVHLFRPLLDHIWKWLQHVHRTSGGMREKDLNLSGIVGNVAKTIQTRNKNKQFWRSSIPKGCFPFFFFCFNEFASRKSLFP